MAFLKENHGHTQKPGTQVGAQNKDFGAVSQAQLFKRLIMLRYIYRMIARFFVMGGALSRVLKARAL